MTATAIGTYATATLLKSLVGITDTTDDTLLGLICDRVNQYIESQTKQVIAPISSATYLYDGNGLKYLYLPQPVDGATKSIGGLRAITLLEFGSLSAGVYTYTTVASTDFQLRDRHGMNGPYRWLLMSTSPAGSYTTFPSTQRIRITATAGWAAIPDDVTEAALNIAKTVWNAHQVGGQTVIGMDDQGPVIQNFVGGRDRQTLLAYKVRPV